jgi:hypothetical protein
MSENGGVSEIPDAEFEAFFTDPYQRRLARYGEIIDNWSAFLAPGHLFTGRFDDIARRPEELLDEIFHFLGIAGGSQYTHRLARQTVNRTESIAVPEKHRRFLEEWLAPEIEDLEQRFGLSWPRS